METLFTTGILDTEEEKSFNAVVELASQICGTPISLVSLVDRERQWFKARRGLEPSETPRELSFCAHAIHRPDEVMIVPDAMADERFADNALVTGEPHIRFYAGAPLLVAGAPVGTLCVIDTAPRFLNPPQLSALRTLAECVGALLEVKRQARQLTTVNAQLEMFGHAIAHEMRGPLRGMVAHLEDLREDAVRAGESGASLDAVYLEAKRLYKLVERMRSLSEWRATAERGGTGTADVSAVAAEVVRAMADRGEGGMRVDIQPGMWLPVEASLLHVVLENLLSNAWKFTHGVDDPAASVEVVDAGKTRALVVRDNGAGFAPSEAQRIFRPFERLDIQGMSGTGIGLATVASIAGYHGGMTWADSTPGKGAALYVTFAPGASPGT